jgi:hypothetical protein
MAGTIVFEHDTINDIIIAKPVWKVTSLEDCEIWYNQWVDYLSKFNRKMDVVIILDDFTIDVGIAAEWGKYRAMINNDHTRFSYRINPTLLTGAFIKTSGSIYHAASDEAPSIEMAYEAIKADRKKFNVT